MASFVSVLSYEVAGSPFNLTIIPVNLTLFSRNNPYQSYIKIKQGEPAANTTYIPNMASLNNTVTSERVEFAVQLCDSFRNNITTTPYVLWRCVLSFRFEYGLIFDGSLSVCVATVMQTR